MSTTIAVIKGTHLDYPHVVTLHEEGLSNEKAAEKAARLWVTNNHGAIDQIEYVDIVEDLEGADYTRSMDRYSIDATEPVPCNCDKNPGLEANWIA